MKQAMKAPETYRPPYLLSNSGKGFTRMNLSLRKSEAFMANNADDGEKSTQVEAGDSWVPVTCEVENGRSYVMFSEYRRPGLSHVSTTHKPNPNLALYAKKLGTTYRTNFTIKGNITFKHKTAMKTISIKKILIPTDFSETGMLALEHAIFLSRLLKAELYLLH